MCLKQNPQRVFRGALELIDEKYEFVKSFFHEDRYEFEILNQKIEIDFNSILAKIEQPQIDPNMNYI